MSSVGSLRNSLKHSASDALLLVSALRWTRRVPMVSNDSCLLRTGHTKKAGVTVYLMEELGDARMRADQLLRYIDSAVKLIEQSEHRDHFFEVAGHLIQSIPMTAFKLEKALQAVALAADRLDYEEIKQNLRPEKVEQLENVLKDVRVRQVQRRSEPPMNPKQAADLLKEIAQQTRESGNLPIDRVLHLAADLEAGTKTASMENVDPGDLLDRLAAALDTPPEEGKDPSRVRLAAVLRRLASDEALKVMAAEGEDEADEQEGQDKTAGAEDAVLLAKYEYLKQLAIVALRSSNGGRWRLSLVTLAELVNQIGAILGMFGADAETKIHAIFREIRQTAMTAQKVMREQEAQPAMVMGADAAPVAEPEVSTDAALVGKYEYIRQLAIVALRHANGGRWKMALMSLAELVGQIGSILALFGTTDVDAKINVLYREIRQTALTAQKIMREQELQPAVVMAMDELVPEPNVEPGEPLYGRAMVSEALDAIVPKARMAKLAFDGGNTKKMFFNLLGILNGLGEIGRAFDITEVGYLVRVYKQFARRSSGRPAMNFSASESDKDSKFEEGKPADPTENMSPEDAKKWKTEHEKNKDNFKEASGDMTNRINRVLGDIQDNVKELDSAWKKYTSDPQKFKPQLDNMKQNMASIGTSVRVMDRALDGMSLWKEAVEGDKDSKFEEGKPADPTENMSPEDAKKWKTEHDKNKDNFKAAGSKYGISADVLSKEAFKVANGLYDARGETRDFQQMLQDAYEDMTGLGPSMTHEWREKNLKVNRDLLYKLDQQIGEVARGLEGLGRDVKKLPKTAAESDKDSKFEEGKPADPTKDMSPEDAKKWKQNTEEYGDKFKKEAVEGDKDSKFEEGKPADPTENMSPEDAKKWKTEHDKNKDNFKSASAWKVGAGEGRRPFDGSDSRKIGAGRTKHLESDKKPGYALCGERHDKRDLVDSVKDTDCYYCKQAWERSNKAASEDEFKRAGVGTSFVFLIETPDEGYEVLTSVLDDPRAGGQVLKDNLSRHEAESLAERLSKRWGDPLLKFKQTGDWPHIRYTKMAFELDKEAASASELKEMQELLKKYDYDPKDAKKLQHEGMGSYELEHILKSFKPGAMSSLEYTHGLKKIKNASSDQWKAG
jgi:hypothetical protein